jgi:hypothetical protein
MEWALHSKGLRRFYEYFLLVRYDDYNYQLMIRMKIASLPIPPIQAALVIQMYNQTPLHTTRYCITLTLSHSHADNTL